MAEPCQREASIRDGESSAAYASSSVRTSEWLVSRYHTLGLSLERLPIYFHVKKPAQ